MSSIYQIPSHVESFIQKAVENEGLSLTDAADLAQCVKRLSDHYIQNPKAKTPWNEKWARVAYAAYYLPLNYVRVLRVAEKCQERNFFEGIEHLVDFGAGLATATASLQSYLPNLSRRILIESSSHPAAMIENRWAELETSGAKLRWEKNHTENMINFPEKSLAVFSYSLTELEQIPEWALPVEALLIIEPATQEDGRRVLGWRNELLAQGFRAYAPCTHQNGCPLLLESNSDWCHDRVHVQMPKWFEKMEEFLPIKNKTLTVTYLAVRKKEPTPVAAGMGRLTGDLLKENGKDRQLICLDSKRQYLSWMHRHGKHREHKRGDFYTVESDYEVRSNELRVPKDKFDV